MKSKNERITGMGVGVVSCLMWGLMVMCCWNLQTAVGVARILYIVAIVITSILCVIGCFGYECIGSWICRGSKWNRVKPPEKQPELPTPFSLTPEFDEMVAELSKGLDS